eukprot:TRINITY_DN59607_c0_g1_i1.p1 TRINITY_DN59607_c0_g1~~TRINITY_DN59607_c0_g1_i1.p1  ORF type:complete len:254 (-),score=50.62 TRINITY_DN59607_c0_g1_i1:66-827(-)
MWKSALYLLKKEQRVILEIICLNMMELSYFYTFKELPEKIKLLILEIGDALAVCPSELPEKRMFVIAFRNFIDQALKCDGTAEIREKATYFKLSLRKFIGKFSYPKNSLAESEPAVSYYSIILEENKKLLESFFASKKIDAQKRSTSVQTEESKVHLRQEYDSLIQSNNISEKAELELIAEEKNQIVDQVVLEQDPAVSITIQPMPSIEEKVPPISELPPASESEDNDSSIICLLYTSPSPRDLSTSRMPSSA